jgi:hypothetical protein
MEQRGLESTRKGSRWLYHLWWLLLDLAAQAFLVLLRLTGGHRRGRRNARNLGLREVELSFQRLPEAFDGFRILHLTDLHLDGMEGLSDQLAKKIEELERVDLLALTGDLRRRIHGPHAPAMAEMQKLMRRIGFLAREKLAVLGNHDSVLMVESLQAMGFEVLINGETGLCRNGQEIRIVGTDDVHSYFTPEALETLAGPFESFTISLVHSPELACEASDAGVDLYLCGHTHGGQICLPGPVPLVKHLTCCREYWSGLWRCGRMQGLTSRGVGTSGIDVRFHAPPEIWLITLRRDGGARQGPLSQR